MFGWLNRAPTDHVDEIVDLTRREHMGGMMQRDSNRRMHRNDVQQVAQDQSRAQDAWEHFDKERQANLALMRRVAELEAQVAGQAPPTQPVVEILCNYLHDAKMDLRALRDAIDVAQEGEPEKKRKEFMDKVIAAYRRIGEDQREDEISLGAKRNRFRTEFLPQLLR